MCLFWPGDRRPGGKEYLDFDVEFHLEVYARATHIYG